MKTSIRNSFLLLLTFLLSLKIFASFEIDKLCEDIDIKTCDTNHQNQNILGEIGNNFNASIFEHQFFFEEAKKYSTELKNFKNEWSDFLRFVNFRHKNFGLAEKETDKHEEYENLLNTLLKQADELIVLEELIQINTAQLNHVSMKHLPLKRIELEEKQRFLNSYKEELKTEYFWWSQADFKELSNISDENLRKKEKINILTNHMVEAFQGLDKANINYQLSKAVYEKPENSDSLELDFYLINSKMPAPLRDQIISRAFINWSEKSSHERKAWCHISKKSEITKDFFEKIDKTSKIVFLVASLAPTPLALSLRTTRAMRMAGYIQTVASAGLMTDLAINYNLKANECSLRHVDYLSTQKKEELQNLEQCLNEEESLRISVLLSFIPVATVAQLPSLALKIKNLRSYENIFPKKYITTNDFQRNVLIDSKLIGSGTTTGSISIDPMGKVITQIDTRFVSKVNGINVDQYTADYFNFVGKIYGERLKLSSKEIDSFVESSKVMSDRMYIVTQTKSLPNAKHNSFDAGISLVSSKHKDELLPLEKATGVLIDRPKNGGIVLELSRLVVSKEAEKLEKGIFQRLLNQSLEISMGNPSVEKFVYYTSKGHYKIYDRIGIKGKVKQEVNDGRDVIVEVDRATVEEYLERIKTKVIAAN